MSVFDKINVGSIRRNSRIFNLSRDVHTTANFGFVQPSFVMEVIPQDERVTIDCKSATRCNPLVVPSYAKIKTKQYFRFIPMSEVQRNWDKFLDGQKVKPSGQTSSYIPQRMPSVKLNRLAYMLLCFCGVERWKKAANSTEYVFDTSTTAINKAHFMPSSLASDTYLGNLWTTHSRHINVLDQSFGINGSDFFLQYLDTSTSDEYIYAFTLSDNGNNLRKVLLGLGYQIDFGNEQYVSILPLIAYYKGWFDLFEIQRRYSWSETAAYNLIDDVYEDAVAEFGEGTSKAWQDFCLLYQNLKDTYYTADPDYFTSQNDRPSMAELGTYVQSIDPTSSVAPSPSAVTTNGSTPAYNLQPTLKASLAANTPLGVAQLKLAQAVYKLVNSKSVLGGKLAANLEAKYGAKLLSPEDTFAFGQSEYMQNIDDVVSMADTDNASIGDYTGFSKASNGFSVTFNASKFKQFGYIIAYHVVVPESKYVQGVDRMLFHGTTDKSDFYVPSFDGIGFQLTTRGEYMGSQDTLVGTYQGIGYDPSAGFGYAPRYLEYKTNPHHVCNGYISRRATRNTFLPYMLDRWFTPKNLVATPAATDGHVTVSAQQGYTVSTVDKVMRFIGRDPQMGNFNRIFQLIDNLHPVHYDPRGAGEGDFTFGADNFICHNIYNVKRYSAMIPVQDSYETLGGESVTGSHE